MKAPTAGTGLPPDDPSLRSVQEVAAAMRVDPAAGLAADEAARRLAADGPNELRAAAATPIWRRILAQFRDPLVYLLLVAVAVSLLAWLAEGAHGLPIDAVAIGAILLLNAAIGFAQEARAEGAVAALTAMTAATSTVLRDGEAVVVPSARLVRGDVLLLAEGDAVGADARLFEAAALRLAEASLTGESEAVGKDPATLPASAPLGDRRNMVFKGTAVVQGSGRAVVTATGMATEVGAVARMLEQTVQAPTPLQREIAAIGRTLGGIVVAVALLVMLTIVLLGGARGAGELVTVLLLGISLAVAAVPEGLPAILSVVLSLGVQRMARRKAVVKRLDAVEALGSSSVICTDKTGTLTRNEMTVERIVTASGEVRVTGLGYRPEGRVLGEEGALRPGALLSETQLVLAGGALANNARLQQEDDGAWAVQGDPSEAAFLVAAGKLGETDALVADHQRMAEIPFTSDRKMMSTLHRRRSDGRMVLFSKGAPDVLLHRCNRLQVGGTVLPLGDEAREAMLATVEVLSAKAMRPIAVAYRLLLEEERAEAVLADPSGQADAMERGLVYLGSVGIIDPPRSEAAQAIAEARRAGIRVVMITGDHPGTARRIATDLGILAPGGRVVGGAELDGLDDDALRALAAEASVYARVAPLHKLRLVAAMQAAGEVVCMTGDGVNDAPALKAADIGVAMGITGTEVSKEAARMILADDNFVTIVAAVRQGRVIFDNVRKFLRYLLSSNVGEVLTVFLGVVFAGVIGLAGASGDAVVLPLLATQILWINLVTDSTPALAMGIDPEIDDVMARRPRRPGDRAIDGRMWAGILSTGLVMAIASLLAIDAYLPGGLIEGGGGIELARTAGFTTLVLAQLFNALNARSETSSAFRGLFANPWLWGAIVLGAALQLAVVELPFLQASFGTVPLALGDWLLCTALASAVLWFGELRKGWLRRRMGHGRADDSPPPRRRA